MAVTMHLPLYYIAGVYLAVVVSIALWNFWRAPPPAGHRPHLATSIILLSLGVAFDGGGKIGLLTEQVAAVGDLLILFSLIFFIYVSRKIYRVVEEVA